MANAQTTLQTTIGLEDARDVAAAGAGANATNPEAPASLAGLRAGLFSAASLAALGPRATGVPQALWRRALMEPVEEILLRPGKGFRGRLTEIAYRLAGGRGRPPETIAAMLEIIHAGSMIVDDIEDGSRERRGGPTVHRLYGIPLALNAGNWMYFAPFAMVDDLKLPAAAELRMRKRMSQVMLDCHYGQALDLAARPSSVEPACLPDVVATLTTLKTGRLLGFAAEAGALCGGGDPALTEAIAAFGEALGVGLQMLDDLGNLSGRAPADKRYEDLRNGRVTWPWAWAAQQLERSRFEELVSRAERLGAGDQGGRQGQHQGQLQSQPGVARWEPLAATLRTATAAHGRLQAHWHLREALCRLRDCVGENPLVDAVEREIERLEVSYG
ncbi:MAG TPA: polyprenyl synthetase family protein [Polyangia bacterium]